MTEYLVNEIDLSNVATAIRQKTGGVNLISFPDEYISGIESLTNTNDATATDLDILSGKTAWVKGTKISGSIGTKAATTIIPGTSDQTIASGVYLAGNQTIKGDSNLTADNIKSGTSIFGVTGSYVDSTPIEISTDAGMEAVLTSSNVGKVYKFTGTSNTYTNGDLYIVEVG